MTYVLSLVICSAIAGQCLPPYIVDKLYKDGYDCMLDGYKMAIEKTIEIGREDINEHEIYIRFICSQYIPEDNTKQDT